MQKTKFGITTGAYAAITFLSGLASYLVVIIMAGYALLFEEDETLKKNVLKAVVFLLSIAAIHALIGSVNNAFSFVDTFVESIFEDSFNIRIPQTVQTLLTTTLSIIEKLGLIIFASTAAKNIPVSIPVVNNYIDKAFKNQ